MLPAWGVLWPDQVATFSLMGRLTALRPAPPNGSGAWSRRPSEGASSSSPRHGDRWGAGSLTGHASVDRVSVEVRLGLLTEWIIPELVDEVLTACGRQDAEPRPLSSRFMICSVHELALLSRTPTTSWRTWTIAIEPAEHPCGATRALVESRRERRLDRVADKTAPPKEPHPNHHPHTGEDSVQLNLCTEFILPTVRAAPRSSTRPDQGSALL